MTASVLMVCEGNICRSPMAAALLAHATGKGVTIASAGVAALDGKPADPYAIELMRERGFDLSAHVARTLTPHLLSKHELVLTMTHAQRSWLLGRYPFARGRVYLLLNRTGHDVADPFRLDRAAFAASLTQIDTGVAEWAALLNESRADARASFSLSTF